jgi:hypothetical protein
LTAADHIFGNRSSRQKGEKMAVLPLSKPAKESAATPSAVDAEGTNWLGFAAGGALVAAGLLLLSGERRAGMVAAASGTALALLDQHSWWQQLPSYIDQVQNVLAQVQSTVNDVADKREALHRALAR